MIAQKTIPFLVAACIVFGQQTRRVDDNALKSAGKAGDEWLTYGLTQGETRYSPLNQINTTNVSRLTPGWSYDVGVGGGSQEATPLVSNGTIYGITNWSIVFAVDARTGKERWRWDPEVNQTAVFPRLCCGVVNRGLAIYQGMIMAPVNDGRLIALNADTGKPIWEARVAYPQDQQTITMAPRIAKGKVIIGVSGGDRPTRGYFDAYDAITGKRAWRFYTVPGDPSKGFENSAMRKAAETWDNEWWKLGGGGAVWDGMAYDPEADLIYVGTGNAEPWPGTLRSKDSQGKDNLYTASIVAVQPETGELKWHYQMLADLNVGGKLRKVIMQANKDGFYYVMDRVNGQFISAQPFSTVNWAKGIDQKTGRPIVNPEAYYGKEAISISPGGGGAHNWSPMSFNPNTGLVYIPTSTTSSPFTYAAADAYPGTGTGTARPAPPNPLPSPPAIGPPPLERQGTRGALVAWDPVAQTMKWRMPGGGGIGGGTVTTAGNLVFQAINDGRLVAYSADKGEELLEIQTGLRGGMGPPITYQIDGKQYVAVMGGTGEVKPRNGQAAAPPPATPAAPPPLPKLLTYSLSRN
jgi:quinohemoprotein ethanol dehydrogenase